MANKILVGPLLGLESESLYTFCVLTDRSVSSVKVMTDAGEIVANAVGDTPRGKFWRAEGSFAAKPLYQKITYQVKLDNEIAADGQARDAWTFYVPGQNEKPLLAYASCNGFSTFDLRNKTDDPYRLWREMAQSHARIPYSLLLMGGDQLYADSVWNDVTTLKKWGELSRKRKVAQAASNEMLRQLERFYERIYRERWADPDMSLMLASVPSVMMWDDHDIFDGWGSYPKDLHECDVYQAIFGVARRYFELFQMRTKANHSLLNPSAEHYGFAFTFRGYHILALDNRAERTLTQVMSEQQWSDINTYLSKTVQGGDLLVLSAVPVIYRDFSFTESVFDTTPWSEELTDDLKDHWRAKEHQGERARLIMRLLDNTKARQQHGKYRTLLLSGDVHLGCLGVINDNRAGANVKIHQVVSSGIVHPAPSRIAWIGIMAVTNDDDEFLNEEHTIRISMLKPFSSDKYIRSRNYVSLKEGTDEKLWVNWLCEQKDHPAYPLES
ncbi:alkaline phosphatase family protein [Photobacterium sp. CCB-ST2H9]|uniref:alkaline phosphatase D family protein n=1 Tax=Photobacterium sp. CCB-ST2H9 TaxID=2912855 RepID=UPI002005820F|nr:alkaline phosphatase D family protein [Photobacterium sp. CCB-ST2H9]UTM58138.1 alkaline phosphatase family protein [Photobacterium sp. CCB-ST2H9]